MIVLLPALLSILQKTLYGWTTLYIFLRKQPHMFDCNSKRYWNQKKPVKVEFVDADFATYFVPDDSIVNVKPDKFYFQ